MSGKLGIYVFMRRKGAQVQRSLVTPEDRKTYAQGFQRAKLANIIANYRELIPIMKGAFETKPERQSDYNAFMQANLTDLPTVYFVKELAARGAGVCMPYQVSRGTLPPVAVTLSPAVESAWQIGVTLTGAVANQNWGAFSTAMVEGSGGVIRNGDVITVIGMRQSRKVGQGVTIPRVTGFYASKTVDVSSEDDGTGWLPGGMVWKELDTDQLGIDWPGNSDGALTVIVSRKQGDRLLVSTQSLVLGATATDYENWITEEAAKGAAESYGNNNTIVYAPTRQFAEQ